MQVIFLRKFSKDLDHITNQKDLESISRIIHEIKEVQTLKDIPGIKKLVGYQDAYRIRCGDYRIGIFVEAKSVIFARVAHRKDIYRLFP